MSGSGEIRSMTEGALLAGISVVLALAGFYLPIVGPIVVLLWPVPIVVIHVRHGLRMSLLTVATAAIVLTALIGPLGSSTVVLSSGIVGIALGTGFRGKWSTGLTFGLGVVAVLVSSSISLAVASFVMHVNVIDHAIQLFERSMQTSFAVYDRMGLGGESAKQAKDAWEHMLSQMRYLLPTAFVGAAFLHGFVNFEASQVTLRKLGYQVSRLPPFDTWRLPVWAVAGFFAGGILAHVGSSPPGWVKMLGSNLFYAFSIAFLTQGLATAYHFLSRYRIAKWLKVVILVYVCMVPLLSQLLIWVGVLDAGFDFRRLIRRRRERSPGEL